MLSVKTPPVLPENIFISFSNQALEILSSNFEAKRKTFQHHNGRQSIITEATHVDSLPLSLDSGDARPTSVHHARFEEEVEGWKEEYLLDK